MSETLENVNIQSPEVALSPALNFQNLRQIGLDTIISSGSEQWTDYNEHDPGITILESLIYSLTDLAYRTDFPIGDIIAQQQLPIDELAKKQFYTARTILSSDPVTFNDLRKKIIDLKGIDNAWIQKSNDSLNTFGGMIDILVDATAVDLDPDGQQQLLEKVSKTYYSHRTIGQDLDQIILRTPLGILFNLELVLTPTANAEEVVATAISKLEDCLSNTVNFLSYQEMLETVGGEVNQVFNGPSLIHGFIPDSTLLPIPQSLKSVDLIPVLNAIPGIVVVSSLTMRTSTQEENAIIKNIGTKKAGTNQGKWFNQIDLPQNQRPLLAPLAQQQLTVLKGKTPYELNFNRLEFELKKINSQKRVPKLAAEERDLPIPVGNFRNIEQYYSIQQDFPQIYGLDPIGPPPNATQEHLGKIKQLKAYLLFFDQVMANYLAQLSNLGQLFSWDKNIAQTYFFQGLESAVNKLGELLFDYPLDPNSSTDQTLQLALDQYKSKLALFRENETTFLNRRNRFLDHLLARFGRNLTEFTESINQTSVKAQQQVEMETKLRVLNHYATMSAQRGRAHDQFKSDTFAGQFSGIRLWVERLFDMTPESENIVHFNKRFVKNTFDSKDKSKHVFSKYILTTEDERPIDMKEIMRIGGDKKNYYIDYTPEEGHHILLYKIKDTSRPTQIYKLHETYDNDQKTVAAIDELTELIGKYDKTSERIFVVEHLLLRPTDIESYFGLELIDKHGNAWMKTKKWYSKNDLAQITIPPNPKSQYYYCIKTQKNPNPPLSKTITDTQNKVTKKIYPKFIFFIQPKNAKAKFVKYEIKLLFGAPGQVLELTSTTPFESKEIAQQSIEEWITRLKKNFKKNNSSNNNASLWRPVLKPWKKKSKKTKKYNNIISDPYSFIFTVAVPNWPSRFQKKSFKKALEKVIAREAPAHLWPNILWLGKVKMQEFEQLHFMWWNAYLSNEPDAYCYREELMKFIMKHSFSKKKK